MVIRLVLFSNRRERTRRKSQTVTMSQQRKLNCPICNYPKLTNLSRHLTTVHGISDKERKALLLRARFLPSPTQQDRPQPSTPLADSALTQFGNSLPKTSSLPEQRQLPNPTSNENEDELIPCLYDSRISYERVWAPMFLLWTMTSSNCTTPSVC